jgi:hypothetical protein
LSQGRALGQGAIGARAAGKTLNVTGTLTVGSGAALLLTGGPLSVGSLTLNGIGYVLHTARGHSRNKQARHRRACCF